MALAPQSTSPFEAGDTLFPLADLWAEQSRIYVNSENNQLLFMHIHEFKSSTHPLFLTSAPNPSDVFIKPRRASTQHRDFLAIEDLASRHIDLAKGGKLLLNTLKATIQSESGLDPTFVEHSLRVLVGQRALIATLKDTRAKPVELCLSETARASERRRSYATSFAHELTEQSDRIKRLICHSGTVGTYREDLLRALIQRHIPNRFHAATGFIDGCPKQLDILIYDQTEYAPLFRAGDLVVVPPAAVRAVIEVKTTLDSKELIDSLLGLKKAAFHVKMSRLLTSGPPIFTGVFAYDGVTVPTLLNTIQTFYSPPTNEKIFIDENPFIDDVGDMADAVCVLRQSILLSRFVPIEINGLPSLTPQFSELESRAGRDFQASVFFDHLSRFLRHPFDGERLGDDELSIFASDVILGLNKVIYGNKYWGPYVQDEWVSPFESRAKAHVKWLSGHPWSDSTPAKKVRKLLSHWQRRRLKSRLNLFMNRF